MGQSAKVSTHSKFTLKPVLFECPLFCQFCKYRIEITNIEGCKYYYFFDPQYQVHPSLNKVN